jgi:hypothetical protein
VGTVVTFVSPTIVWKGTVMVRKAKKPAGKGKARKGSGKSAKRRAKRKE